MHLLAADIGRIDDGEAAVDLDQAPGDIVFLSAADSEIAALMAAADREAFGLSVRRANLGQLSHPLSIDLLVEKTLAKARLVVVRLMGGEGYWAYGLDRLRALARGGGPMLIAVPGEDRWDPALEAYSTAPLEAARLVWRYLVEGGPTNTDRVLQYAAHLLGRAEAPPGPEVVPRAGCYWPGEGPLAPERLRGKLDPDLPFAPIVFYRAYIQGALTAPIDALAASLAEAGINPVPVFVASLKERESSAFLADIFESIPPAIVLNTTAFAVSTMGAAHGGTILDRPGRPVLQVVLAGASEEAWLASARGLPPRDLTMNVVLPEVDGRLLTRAISFKAEDSGRGTVEHRPRTDRVQFVVEQAKAWITLARRPAADRRVGIVLSNYPSRDGRIANGVGLDTPESAVVLAWAMQQAGYRLDRFPETSEALMGCLLGGTTNQLHKHRPSSRRTPGSTAEHPQSADAALDSGFRRNDALGGLSIDKYRTFFNRLPPTVRDALTERWGAPEDDPFFIGDAFRLGVHRFGNVVVGIQPQRGYDVDPKATYHDPDLVPPHHYLAFYAWLRHEFGADAVVHPGKHGNLEWLPGKALGLSETCWPEVALGPTPLIYPFIVNDPGEGSQAKRRASAVIVDHLMPAMTRAEIHGPLAELETLIDEYYLAAGVDRAAGLSGAEIIARPSVMGSTAISASRAARRRGPSGARRASLRAEGDADPRRAACARPVARRTAADRYAGRHRADAALGRTAC
jgi:cobaltochelatase CobN